MRNEMPARAAGAASIDYSRLLRAVSRFWLAVAIATAASGSLQAAPRVPASDAEVVEKLPYNLADPALRELRAAQRQLAAEPDNLDLALHVARGYSERGRITGDPRWSGYAEAALRPWLALSTPPREVLLLRATLAQRSHRFDAALADLDALLRIDPSDAQARLTRATVLQVRGQFQLARRECRRLERLTSELIAAACTAAVNGATGRQRASHDRLEEALRRHSDADPGIRAWVLTELGEMAARADLVAAAETHFRQALALEPTDFYLLGAYADFLLDQGRGAEAANLLKGETKADPLLLRYVLALKSLRSSELQRWVDELRSRFDASRARGDKVHLREEARFTLHLLHDAKAALTLAQENWAVQKEPADLRILLEASFAAGDTETLRFARAWRTETGLEDVSIARLLEQASVGTRPNPANRS
jgi:Tfp pilus assembly protein PilF